MNKTLIYSFVMCMLVLPGFISKVHAQDDKLVAIVSSNISARDYSKDEVKEKLLGKTTRWDDKSKITLALMKPETPVGEAMAQKFIGMSSTQLNKYYLTMVFQGKITAPKFFISELELVQFVVNNPGAIGVVSAIHTGSAQVLMVDGRPTL